MAERNTGHGRNICQERSHHGRIVRALHRHGDGRGAAVARLVFHRVGEHIAQRSAGCVERLHRGVAVVHGVTVASVSTDHKRAKAARQAGPVGAGRVGCNRAGRATGTSENGFHQQRTA